MKIYKNNQEVFDIIWHKFVVNKQQRNISRGRCIYEHPGCFIGCLLTARDARMLDNRKDKQGQYYIVSIRAILQPYAFEEKKEKVKVFQRVRDQFENCNPNFLIELQHIHDENMAEKWRQKLIELAETYGLTVQLNLEV